MVGPGAVSRPAVGGGARDPTLHCVTWRSSSSRVGQFCGRDISDISYACHLKAICAKNSRDKSEAQERLLNVLVHLFPLSQCFTLAVFFTQTNF